MEIDRPLQRLESRGRYTTPYRLPLSLLQTPRSPAFIPGDTSDMGKRITGRENAERGAHICISASAPYISHQYSGHELSFSFMYSARRTSLKLDFACRSPPGTGISDATPQY